MASQPVAIQDLDVLLARSLSAASLEERVELLRAYKSHDWESYIPSSRTMPYTRVPLFRTAAGLEIRLIEWPPRAKSPIHEHAVLGCALLVLRGTRNETVWWNSDTDRTQRTLGVGDVSRITNKDGVHRIENPGVVNAYSLHVYLDSKSNSKL